MLIPLRITSKLFKISPSGVLHVGAHKGEELEIYSNLGWQKKMPTIWIEAQSNLCEELLLKFDPTKNIVINAVVSNTDGTPTDFFITSNSQSSSILRLGTHSILYPNISVVKTIQLVTSRLDSILPDQTEFDFVNLDIQGNELRALQGLEKRIQQIRWIYTEVNRENVYLDCAHIDEIDKYLLSHGFIRVCTVWMKSAGWGDALYMRKDISPSGFKIRKVSFELILTVLKFYAQIRTLMDRTFGILLKKKRRI